MFAHYYLCKIMRKIYSILFLLAALISCKNDTEILSFEMKESEITMHVGETYQLSAAVSYSGPDIAIEWTSSDMETVSVDNDGNLNALKTGNAVISAKCLDKELDCSVTVIPQEPEPDENGNQPMQ